MKGSSIPAIFERRKILITAGTGGVGKTTLSAALAVRSAMLGRKTIVLTVDPAKRLANSLGIETLGDTPTDLTAHLRSVCPEAQGTLEAVVPDTQRTFHDWVHSLSKSEAVTRRILENPIFELFQREFSGANEYMAVQRLSAIHQTGRYDTIILDTPPSRNTLNFLDAADTMSGLFDERLVKWLLTPANKLVAIGLDKAVGVLEKLTGAAFISQFYDFVRALFEMRFQFNDSLGRMNALLSSTDTGFLLVSAPRPEMIPEFSHLVRTLSERKLHFEGIIANRTLSEIPILDSERADPLWSGSIRLIESIQTTERKVLAQLEQILPDPSLAWIKVPELTRDIHCMEDLAQVARVL